MQKLKSFWILALLQIVCAPYGAAAELTKLSVDGSATLLVAPDFVTLNFYVVREAEKAIMANQLVSQVMNGLIKIARNQGIGEEDLRTSGISVIENSRRSNDCSRPDILAQQSLTLVLRDLKQVEELIDNMIEAGALIQGAAQPGINEREKYEKQALQLAIDDARDQAGVAADQLGLSVGGTLEVSFSSGGSRRTVMSGYASAGFSVDRSQRTYLPGLIPISQSVQVIFESAKSQ